MVRSATSALVSVERFFELSLLGMLTSGYLAVAGSGYLDLPTAVLAALALIVRALMATGLITFQPSGRLVQAVTVAYIVFYPLDYAFISREFLTATVHFVFFLASVKVITAQTGRDYVFLAIVAFLELLAAAVLSANFSFFVFLALFLVFGVATFAGGEMRRSMRQSRRLVKNGLRRVHWRLAALTLAISVGILGLTAGLFFLLPRTAQAAFRHLVPQRYHIPGFSNEVTLGQIGEIQQRSTPVMHVRIAGEGGDSLRLKWRGAALSQFDGKRWSNPPDRGQILRAQDGIVRLVEPDQQRRPGARISYEVQLEAIASDALFLAGTPEFIFTNLPLIVRTNDDGYRLGFGNTGALRYGASSYVAPAEVSPLAGAARATPPAGYLQLPALDPRIPALARSVTHGAVSDEVRARAIEAYLRREYGYTLELLPTEVEDPLAHFLFDRREGHCEYFASAMAVMLRTLGIPARIATGFQSGAYNPISGWYVIRASDAHSWVEAWLPGRGWTTFDPTPPDPNPRGFSLLSGLGLYIDAVETFWRDWVLNYDLNQQLVLASKMETSGRAFGLEWLDRARLAAQTAGRRGQEWLSTYGALLVFLIALAAAGVRYGPRARAYYRTRERVRKLNRGIVQAPDATLIYDRMLGVLKRRGIEKPLWLTPVEFARTIPASPTADLVARFTIAYNDLRFGGDTAAAAPMIELLREIEAAGRGRARV